MTSTLRVCRRLALIKYFSETVAGGGEGLGEKSTIFRTLFEFLPHATLASTRARCWSCCCTHLITLARVSRPPLPSSSHRRIAVGHTTPKAPNTMDDKIQRLLGHCPSGGEVNILGTRLFFNIPFARVAAAVHCQEEVDTPHRPVTWLVGKEV